MYCSYIVCHRGFYDISTDDTADCLFVCFVALRPKSTAIVMAGRSFQLSTFFPEQA